MIYLRDRGLLFLKPYKTAGTSLEIALSRHAGPEDVVTPVIAVDELKRLECGGQFPVNWADAEQEERFKTGILRFRRGEIVQPPKFEIRTSRFFNHMTPKEVAAVAGEDFLLDATVVTMCRHPYEVFVSQVYFFRSYRELDVGFAELAERLAPTIVTNVPFYGYKGRFLPKRVIRYEHLQEDLQALEKEQGLDLVAQLPQTKQGVRGDRRPAREILTRRQKEICYRRSKPIFERFGYEP
jgi:hypothetical protein